MEKILITGGLGFIGSRAATYFIQLNYNVVVVDNLSRPGPNYVSDITNIENLQKKPYILNHFAQKFPNVKIYLEDLKNKSKIHQILMKENPSVIIHAAGQTSASESITHPHADFQDNVVGLLNVLTGARLCHVLPRFLYLSTNKVYGTQVNTICGDELTTRYDLPPNFEGIDEAFGIDSTKHTPYGVSKLCGDLYVQEFCHTYGLTAAIFRMSCIYGPGQFGIEGQAWLSNIIIKALKNRPITIYGNGKQVRDVLYIDDLLVLFEKFITASNRWVLQRSTQECSPHIYNVGGGKDNDLSLLELLKEIDHLIGHSSTLQFSPAREGDQKIYISNITKISREFEWDPRISPKIGIQKLFEWTRENISLF